MLLNHESYFLYINADHFKLDFWMYFCLLFQADIHFYLFQYSMKINWSTYTVNIK